MKLSYLESVVKAMRAHADRNGDTDPNVEFYDDNRPEFHAAVASAGPFFNMELAPDIAVGNICNYAVTVHGSVAQPGDFAIPVKPC